MKKLMFCTVLLLATYVIAAQKKELPAQVKDPFSTKYPNAQEIKQKKQRNSYRIKFVNDGMKITCTYDLNGNWQKSEYILDYESIPGRIRQTISKKYPKGSFHHARVTESGSGETDYFITVDTEKFAYYLILDQDGKITKSEKVSNDGPKPAKDYSTEDNPDNDEGGDGR